MGHRQLPAVIDVDLARSRRGLECLLGEDLGGKSVLTRTLEAVLSCRRLERPVICVHRRDEEETQRLIGDIPVAWWVHEEGDISRRARLRRGRLWGKEGWRGGLGESYFAAEAGNPRALHGLFRMRAWEAAMLVPAEAAFFDPAIADELVAAFFDKHQLPLLLSTAPPGIGGDIISARVVEQFAAHSCSFEALLSFQPDRSESDPDSQGVFHHFSEEITGHRGRYTIDSRAALRWARELWQGIGPDRERGACRELFRWSASHPEERAGVVPEEVIVELGADGSGALPAREGIRDRSISNPVWERVQETFRERDDALLTLGGGRHDPVSDDRLHHRIREARAAGALGIHVETPGALLDPERAARLLEADPDVVTVDLTAPTAELQTRMRAGGPPFEPRAQGLETLLDARAGVANPPFVVVSMVYDIHTAGAAEGFFDRYAARADRVVLRGVEGFRGEASPDTMGVFAPPRRFACQRLLTQMRIEGDGRVPLCNRDPHLERLVGQLPDQSVAEVWQSEPFATARRVHAQGEWNGFFHCGPCVSWFRWD